MPFWSLQVLILYKHRLDRSPEEVPGGLYAASSSDNRVNLLLLTRHTLFVSCFVLLDDLQLSQRMLLLWLINANQFLDCK